MYFTQDSVTFFMLSAAATCACLTEKALDPVKPIRREEQKRVSARFEGEPTYKGRPN